MNQRQTIALLLRIKPRSVKRQMVFRVGYALHQSAASIAFAFREPMLWWFSRRVWMHYSFGLPLPLTDRQRGRFQA